MTVRQYRPRTGVAVRAGVALILAVGATGAVTSVASVASAGPECANVTEVRDRWTPVPAVPGPRPTSIMTLSDDPCVLVAADGSAMLPRTEDGGRSWQRVSLTKDVVRVFGDGLPARHVIAAYRDGGLAVSRDGGRTFDDVTMTAPGEVIAATGNPSDTSLIYVVVNNVVKAPAAVGVLPSLYVSTDGGKTFAPRAASAPIRATTIAVDPAAPLTVWLNDTAPAVAAGTAVWRSTDGGVTFAPPASRLTSLVTDLAFGAVPDGPSRLVATNADGGVWSTSDGGAEWTRHDVAPKSNDDPSFAVRFESGSADALMVLSRSGAWRSVSPVLRFRRTRDLPPECAGRSLSRDSVSPSTFLALCSDGRAYRYTSSGTDLTGSDGGEGDAVGPPTSLDPTVPVPNQQLPVLGVRRLPVNDGSSGSLAFDGQVMYYAPPPTAALGGYAVGVIHRMRISDGAALPDLPLPFEAAEMSYDGTRNVVYVQALTDGRKVTMYALDLGTRSLRKMFPLPSWAGNSPFSFDASIDRFVVAVESTLNVFQVDLTGRIRRSCSTPMADQFRPGATALVAAGYGGSAYWQSEDDATLWHIGPDCRVLARYTHRTFSESTAENDALVCDTLTFDKPAIWIRDSETAEIYAYGVPRGYCPLATQVAVTTAGTVDRDSVSPVCARLTIRGGTAPLGDMTLRFTVAGRGLGVARTDSAGRACAQYRAARRASGVPGALEQVVVSAAYLGTRSFLSSAATGLVRVRDLPAAVPVLPPPGVVHAIVPPNLPPPNPPPPNPQPNPQPQPQAQAQSQAQSQSQSQAQSQSQSQAQAVAVPQVQEQIQVAENTVTRDRNMTRRQRDRGAGLPGLGLAVASAMAAAAWAAGHRAQHVLVGTRRRVDRRP